MLNFRIGFPPPPPGFDWAPLIAIAPHLIWGVVVVILFVLVGRGALRAALGRVNKVAVAGFEIGFTEALKKAAEEHGQQVSAIDLGKAARRIESQAALFKGARMLWVDDRPDNNRHEIKLFEGLGARVDTRETSAEAEAAILQVTYDLVISDMDRAGSVTEGLAFASRVAVQRNHPPIVFYVGTAKRPAPATAFGIADQPAELVHLTLDVLGRARS